MDRFRLEDMKSGWFAGDFSPTAFKTKDFEACFRTHKKGEFWDKHYHKVATEINLLVRGRMSIQDTILVAGDIFILYPFEVADPIFLEDCDVMTIKTPSCMNDKFCVD